MKRRTFIQSASLVASGSLFGLRPFGTLSALAQASAPSDYKALVCIFLFGGNDANNMLVPTDDANYTLYSKGRGALALAQPQLLPLTGTSLGLHPNMPELAAMFQSKQLAVLANVGPLVMPITAAQLRAGTAGVLPQNLLSHVDQQVEWQTATQSSQGSEGWAGKMAEKLGPLYGSENFPMALSVAGGATLTNGATTSAFVVTPGSSTNIACNEGNLCSARLAAAQELLTFNTGVTLVQADAAITTNMYAHSALYSNAIAQGTALKTPFPNTQLGSELKQIASILQVRDQLGPRRQIFFASLGGFDTHQNQLATQGGLLLQLSQAMQAFQQSLGELSLTNQVTTFTMSDFARALEGNTTAGTDHAWGGHHMIMGGAVNGGKLYGAFPNLLLGGPDDSSSNGRWVPTTSVAQYGATLASWFGVADADLPYAFDVLPNFSVKNLLFV